MSSPGRWEKKKKKNRTAGKEGKGGEKDGDLCGKIGQGKERPEEKGGALPLTLKGKKGEALNRDVERKKRSMSATIDRGKGVETRLDSHLFPSEGDGALASRGSCGRRRRGKKGKLRRPRKG